MFVFFLSIFRYAVPGLSASELGVVLKMQIPEPPLRPTKSKFLEVRHKNPIFLGGGKVLSQKPPQVLLARIKLHAHVSFYYEPGE